MNMFFDEAPTYTLLALGKYCKETSKKFHEISAWHYNAPNNVYKPGWDDGLKYSFFIEVNIHSKQYVS